MAYTAQQLQDYIKKFTDIKAKSEKALGTSTDMATSTRSGFLTALKNADTNIKNFQAQYDKLTGTSSTQQPTVTAESLSKNDQVSAFNTAFAQPSLISPTIDGMNLSEGDKLALGLQANLNEPRFDGVSLFKNGLGENDVTAANMEDIRAKKIDNSTPEGTGDFLPVKPLMGDVYDPTMQQQRQATHQAAVDEQIQRQIQESTAANLKQADAVQANKRAAVTGLDIGKATTEDVLRKRVRRGIASTIASKSNLSAPLLEKPTLLG
jgi:hypothetical protein